VTIAFAIYVAVRGGAALLERLHQRTSIANPVPKTTAATREP
jgi:hypothetical protein